MGRGIRPPCEGGRRLLLIHLDGLSHRRLERAVAGGQVPFIASLLERGHQLSPCRSGAPASTPAFQAGLLYGVSPSVPGYTWYDRAGGRDLRMDRPRDADGTEQHLAAGRTGLLRGGSAYFSIFTGGATFPYFCLAGLGRPIRMEAMVRELRGWDWVVSGLIHSVAGARALARLTWRAGVDLAEGIAWSLRQGRLKHEPRFLLHRLLVDCIMREVMVQGSLMDISRGLPAIYCNFLGYDEHAHRRGPDSPAALLHLASIDAAVQTIYAAAEANPDLRYDLFLFSDHGQAVTEPFEVLTGLPLGEFLEQADGPGRLTTIEAGDLAHVYCHDTWGRPHREPQDLEAIRLHHPGLLQAVRESRAVGIVAVRAEGPDGHRPVALVRGEELDLLDPNQVASLPHPQPRLLAAYLTDMLSLPDAGDLVVMGWRGDGCSTVAYAWEFGSHGGVTPDEIATFMIHPRGHDFRFDAVLRPSDLHRFFEDAYRRRRRPRRSPAVIPLTIGAERR
jgi:hypothetical protein